MKAYGVSVPTMDDFNALTARVSALEEGTPVPVPPDPPDPPDPITEGVQAKRIVELIGKFGANTFSSLDGNNVWGSWPSDYRPESVAAAYKFILGDSGHTFRIREYHFANQEAMQRQWLQQIQALLPGTETAIALGVGASTNDVPSAQRLAADPSCHVKWIEGINEPNLDFGWGTVLPADTLAVQKALFANKPCLVMGASIAVALPHPENTIRAYFGDLLAEHNRNIDWGNCHYYPPASPDVPNTGYSVNDMIGGHWTAYEEHVIGMTENHPTLYAWSKDAALAVKANIAVLAGRAPRGAKPPPIPEVNSDDARDPIWTLQTLLRCAKNGTQGVWWYALFDYGDVFHTGLFPRNGYEDPRPTAITLQSLCAICADHGDDRRTFAPGKLDVEVSGLTAAMDWDCYQASNGRFLLPLWHAADAGQGGAVPVTLRFATAKRITVFEPLVGMAEVATSDDVREITVNLPPGVVVLEVTTV